VKGPNFYPKKFRARTIGDLGYDLGPAYATELRLHEGIPSARDWRGSQDRPSTTWLHHYSQRHATSLQLAKHSLVVRIDLPGERTLRPSRLRAAAAADNDDDDADDDND